MKLLYRYNDDEPKIHTKFIEDKTMSREGKKSNRVQLWKIPNKVFENLYELNVISLDEDGWHTDTSKCEYITTLSK